MNNEFKIVYYFEKAKSLGAILGLDVDARVGFGTFRVSNKDGSIGEMFESAEATYAFLMGLSFRDILKKEGE